MIRGGKVMGRATLQDARRRGAEGYSFSNISPSGPNRTGAGGGDGSDHRLLPQGARREPQAIFEGKLIDHELINRGNPDSPGMLRQAPST